MPQQKTRLTLAQVIENLGSALDRINATLATTNALLAGLGVKEATRHGKPKAVQSPKGKRARTRNLSTAEWLRPADIGQLTGLSGTTVHRMLTASGEARLPSVQYKGKSGRKGVRLVKRIDLDAFMARHHAGAAVASSQVIEP